MSQQQLVQIDNILQEMQVQSVLKNRNIPMIEEFTRESCYKVMYYMDKLKKLDEINNTIDKTITITISSYGGCAYSLLALVGYIERFKEQGYRINIHLESMGFSAGFYLLMCGSYRTMNRHAMAMIHSMSTGTYGHIQEMTEDMKHNEVLQGKIEELTIKYTKFSDKDMEEIRKYKLDKYMTAEECLEKGIIDEIV